MPKPRNFPTQPSKYQQTPEPLVNSFIENNTSHAIYTDFNNLPPDSIVKKMIIAAIMHVILAQRAMDEFAQQHKIQQIRQEQDNLIEYLDYLEQFQHTQLPEDTSEAEKAALKRMQQELEKTMQELKKLNDKLQKLLEEYFKQKLKLADINKKSANNVADILKTRIEAGKNLAELQQELQHLEAKINHIYQTLDTLSQQPTGTELFLINFLEVKPQLDALLAAQRQKEMTETLIVSKHFKQQLASRGGLSIKEFDELLILMKQGKSWSDIAAEFNMDKAEINNVRDVITSQTRALENARQRTEEAREKYLAKANDPAKKAELNGLMDAMIKDITLDKAVEAAQSLAHKAMTNPAAFKIITEFNPYNQKSKDALLKELLREIFKGTAYENQVDKMPELMQVLDPKAVGQVTVVMATLTQHIDKGLQLAGDATKVQDTIQSLGQELQSARTKQAQLQQDINRQLESAPKSVREQYEQQPTPGARQR